MYFSKCTAQKIVGLIVLTVLGITFLLPLLMNEREDADIQYISLPETIDFNYDIRPILSQNCFVCHGPDTSSRKAGLRLDIYKGATAKLENNHVALIPGNSKQSELVRRITSDDPDYYMPPPESGKTLSKREIALIKKWIDQGAEYKPHWAFTPLSFPNLTGELASGSPSQIIDHLVESQQKKKNLTPGIRAASHYLLRRVSYLITGLPPSLTEQEKFAPIASEEDYLEMVDYYLESPHFGERWARHWMDLVRYGEFRGHEFDYPVGGAWHYRDYLIRAFNDDVPYNQLVLEHLAGDLLPHPRLHPEAGFNESIIGTAYANLGEGKHSPVNVKEEEASTIDNMIDVTSKTFLGLTVGCARCHDHKFDPIPTTDYYAMYGMFESTRLGPVEKGRKLSDSTKFSQIHTLTKDLEELAGIALNEDTANSISLFISTLSNKSGDASGDRDSAIILGDFNHDNWNGWSADGPGFGQFPIRQTVNVLADEIQLTSTNNRFASSRFYTTGIQGSLRSPNFTINRDSIFVLARGDSSSVRIIVDNFQLIQDPLYGSFSAIVDDEEWKVYGLDVSMVKGHKAYLEFIPGFYNWHAYEIKPDNFLDVQWAYMSDYEMAFPIGQDTTTRLVASPNLTSLSHQYQKLKKQLYHSDFFMGMREGPTVLSPVFIRGSHLTPAQEEVPLGFLSALSDPGTPFPQMGSGRLMWAEKIVDPTNPLTTRVLVNRIWHHLFGRGIVETVDNFGLQGTLPSHPELLDFLSLQFIKEDWSIKNMIRHILVSETFRQTTVANSQNATIDPENMYLHHYPIRRLEAEAIRDGILASAGSLNQQFYGKPVPIHLTKFMTGRGRPRQSGPLDGEGRRSIYNEVRRNFMEPMMEVFDRPIPFSTFGRRDITNVPAQSLTLMNDPFIYDQAEKWAKRMLELVPDSDEERIRRIYRAAMSRTPTPEEISNAIQMIKALKEEFETLQIAYDDTDLWKEYCHTIFNLKEFIYLL